MKYWIPAGVASHCQEQEMRTDLVVDETGSLDMTCKEKNEDDKRKGKPWAYSKQTQTVIYNCYNYFRNESQYGVIKKTAEATKVDRKTVTKIANDGPNYPKMPKNNRVAFDKVDGFTKYLIRRTVYEFYDQKCAPTVQIIFQKVKEKTEGTDYVFPYELTSLKKLLKMIGFHFCKTNNRTVLMEIPHSAARRYEYLRKMRKLRAEGFLPVFMDETWYDTHDVVKKAWSDNSGRCNVSKFISKGNLPCRIGIWIYTKQSFICGKSLSKTSADYHQDMNSDVFERWLEKQLLPNLPQKCVLIIDNANYHSRQEVKVPTQATKKAEILEFMMKKNIPIPSPVPTRPVLLERIKLFQVEKEHFVDNLIRRDGHEVLRLPPYHCVLNAIELGWSKLKRTIRSENVFTEQPDKVMHLIKKVCDEISSDEWSKFMRHVEKEGEKL